MHACTEAKRIGVQHRIVRIDVRVLSIVGNGMARLRHQIRVLVMYLRCHELLSWSNPRWLMLIEVALGVGVCLTELWRIQLVWRRAGRMIVGVGFEHRSRMLGIVLLVELIKMFLKWTGIDSGSREACVAARIPTIG